MARRKTKGQYHGYIVVDKPAGWTSHDVVGKVRRILGERRVGHAGTLDPAAVGVLPIAVGLATRTVEYLSDASKAYVAEITFGVTTDSADGDGVVTGVEDAGALDQDRIKGALMGFRGPQLQRPPMHSAIRVDGVRLYEHARKGQEIEVEPRRATIHEIELIDWNAPTATVFIHCSKGTYVRSIARDLGESVGTGAYMSNLVRTHTGPFTLADAVRIDQLADMLEREPWELIAFHPDAVLHDRPALVLDAMDARSWRQGNAVHHPAPPALVRVYDRQGMWLGVGAGSDDRIRPVKVVAEE